MGKCEHCTCEIYFKDILLYWVEYAFCSTPYNHPQAPMSRRKKGSHQKKSVAILFLLCYFVDIGNIPSQCSLLKNLLSLQFSQSPSLKYFSLSFISPSLPLFFLFLLLYFLVCFLSCLVQLIMSFQGGRMRTMQIILVGLCHAFI